MPNEMLISQTIAYSGPKWNTYKYCLIDQTHQMLPSIYRFCNELLPENCTQNAGIAMESHCHWYKYRAERAAGYKSVWERIETPKDLNNTAHTYMEGAFRRYVKCMHSDIVIRAIKHCIPLAKEHCQSSPVIAAKILRVNLWNLDTIIDGHADWKVVHQIRDPRGVLVSQRASTIMTVYSEGSIISESHILCDKMLNDTRSFKLYNDSHPGQYLQVKYEDYADAPVPTVKHIYSHIGSDVNERLVNAIIDLTSAKNDSSPMDQYRKNSSATARKWTTKITSIEKKWIDKTCSDFYKETGYPEYVKLNTHVHRGSNSLERLGDKSLELFDRVSALRNRNSAMRNSKFGSQSTNLRIGNFSQRYVFNHFPGIL